MQAIVLVLIFFALMALGVPIAVSMGASSVAYLLMYMDIPMTVVAQQIIGGMDKFTLLAIPFFMLAGEFMTQGGISERIIDFCRSLVGSMPGGLALVMVIASAIFAAMTGAGAATCAAVGGIMIPFMLKEGYDEDFVCALQSTAGIFGPLIPPSIIMVLFSVATGASVSEMLVAGLMPGIVMTIVVGILAIIICKKRGYRGSGTFSLKGIVKDFSRAILAILTPVIILGGIYSGLFTATEAAAIAAFYALIVGALVYKELTFAKVNAIFVNSMKSSGSLLLVVGSTQILGWILTRENLPQKLALWFASLTNSPIVFMLLVAVLVLIIGCFLDPGPAVLILGPILCPVASTYGIDPIHFGNVLVVGLVCGLITPPVGTNLFAVTAMTGRPVHKYVKDLLPFMGIVLFGYLLVILIPGISTILPSLMAK